MNRFCFNYSSIHVSFLSLNNCPEKKYLTVKRCFLDYQLIFIEISFSNLLKRISWSYIYLSSSQTKIHQRPFGLCPIKVQITGSSFLVVLALVNLHEETIDHVINVAFLLGKTNCVLRFVNGQFRENYVPTIEDTYRQVVSCNKQITTLQITDT